MADVEFGQTASTQKAADVQFGNERLPLEDTSVAEALMSSDFISCCSVQPDGRLLGRPLVWGGGAACSLLGLPEGVLA